MAIEFTTLCSQRTFYSRIIPFWLPRLLSSLRFASPRSVSTPVECGVAVCRSGMKHKFSAWDETVQWKALRKTMQGKGLYGDAIGHRSNSW